MNEELCVTGVAVRTAQGAESEDVAPGIEAEE